MCGLTGYLTPGGIESNSADNVITQMSRCLAHRGPDDHGVWIDPVKGIALGHQRLAILDLSSAGHQPMISESGRYVTVFNGEIYNHMELRQRLPRRLWRGHSDTETLLAGIEHWGLEKTLQASVGMFALGLWDREQHTLSLARDRMGEKPLYYGWQHKTFLFCSELKALKAHPDFLNEIDRESLALYVRRGCVPAPRSIFLGIFKLPPGAIAIIPSDSEPGWEPELYYYWQLKEVITRQAAQRFAGPPEEAVQILEEHLLRAIEGQRIADVPLGAFLSGGIDSSTVVALMQSCSITPVRTFSIGFHEQGYDESHHARKVAAHLHTEHTEFHVTAADALGILPQLPSIYDEPFADASQIPTVLVSRLARQHVTVSLSGDGGDELFCGYGRYPQTVATWQRLQKLPLSVRRLASKLLPSSPLQEGLDAPNLNAFYSFMIRQWKGYPQLVRGAKSINCTTVIPETLSCAHEWMMYADALDYLPNDILTKVDRAAMSCSLETRVPLLDHRVVEFAWSLPNVIKYHQGVGKWPLRQLLYKHVPRELVERPKRGFAVPLEHWLRGSLREWAESLLDEHRLEREGFFKPCPIQQEWASHLSTKHDRHFGLWTILMFQAWLESNKN